MTNFLHMAWHEQLEHRPLSYMRLSVKVPVSAKTVWPINPALSALKQIGVHVIRNITF